MEEEITKLEEQIQLSYELPPNYMVDNRTMRNTYFSNGTHAEKRLYEDLIIEQLKVFGHDVYYMPREEISKDDVLGNTTDKFTDAYSIEMYVEDVNGFAGQGIDLVGQVGIEVRDELTFVVSRRQFEILVEQPDNTLNN